jgi:hypothetical protein
MHRKHLTAFLSSKERKNIIHYSLFPISWLLAPDARLRGNNFFHSISKKELTLRYGSRRYEKKAYICAP